VEDYLAIFVPYLLLLGRVTAFFSVLPLFSWDYLPARIRAALAVWTTIFFGMVFPPPAVASHDWSSAAVLLGMEVAYGLALGLSAHLVYLAIQQGGRIAAVQMGLTDAELIDPVSQESTEAMSLLFDLIFALFFLAAGGHLMLLGIVGRSFDACPIGSVPSVQAMAEGVLAAGSAMLVFALKFAAPMLAAFLVLAVVLAILARVLPEMNILLASFPLRIALGLVLAIAMVPTMEVFAGELARWMGKYLLT
jgi:flagellar biosynthetic protein FliR